MIWSILHPDANRKYADQAWCGYFLVRVIRPTDIPPPYNEVVRSKKRLDAFRVYLDKISPNQDFD